MLAFGERHLRCGGDLHRPLWLDFFGWDDPEVVRGNGGGHEEECGEDAEGHSYTLRIAVCSSKQMLAISPLSLVKCTVGKTMSSTFTRSVVTPVLR